MKYTVTIPGEPTGKGRILAIDPGNTESAYVLADENMKPVKKGKVSNQRMLEIIASEEYDELAIEMIASYGMAVGAEVFFSGFHLSFPLTNITFLHETPVCISFPHTLQIAPTISPLRRLAVFKPCLFRFFSGSFDAWGIPF